MANAAEVFDYFGYGPEADPAFMAALTGSERSRMYEIAQAGVLALGHSLSVQTIEDINNDPSGELSDTTARRLLLSQWGNDFVAPVMRADSQGSAAGTLYKGMTEEELVLVDEWNLGSQWKVSTLVDVRTPVQEEDDEPLLANAFTIGDQFSRYREQAPSHRQHLYFPMGKSLTIQRAVDMRERIVRTDVSAD